MSAETLRRAAALIREDCPIPESSRGFDFIDFPTGFAIQRAGVEHVAACSAAQTSGIILCDCEAIYLAWRRWRTLLALADLLDAADDHSATPCPAIDAASHAARTYLGESA